MLLVAGSVGAALASAWSARHRVPTTAVSDVSVSTVSMRERACSISLHECEKGRADAQQRLPVFDASGTPITHIASGEPYPYLQDGDIWLATYRNGALERTKMVSRESLAGVHAPSAAASLDGRWFAYASFQEPAREPPSSEWEVGGDTVTVVDRRNGTSWVAHAPTVGEGTFFNFLRFQGDRLYGIGPELLVVDPAARTRFLLPPPHEGAKRSCVMQPKATSPNGRHLSISAPCLEGGRELLADLTTRKVIRDFGSAYICFQGHRTLGFTRDGDLLGYRSLPPFDEDGCGGGYRLQTYDPATGNVLKVLEDVPESDDAWQRMMDAAAERFPDVVKADSEQVEEGIVVHAQRGHLWFLPPGESRGTLVDIDAAPIRRGLNS